MQTITDFNNVFYPSDVNGCGSWRGTFPINTIWSMGPDTNVNVSVMQTVTVDPRFYRPMNSVMVQRLVDDNQRKFFSELLKSCSDAFGFWIIYNIDDAMHYKDIVKFNKGRKAFVGEKLQANIKAMLNDSDFVLVTTDYIKNYYHERYEVPLENIIAIPNYLPRWWIGSLYDKDKSCDRFRRMKNKPRVGIVSSLSHYNLDGVMEDETGCVVTVKVDPKTKQPILGENGKPIVINERGEAVDIERCHRVEDDLDLIYSAIEKTMDDVQWVIFGHQPPQLKKYIEAGKVECHPGVPIINYPKHLAALNLNLIVAPVQDCVFNRCKSNIKYLEAAAIGVPLFASDIPAYSDYMPKSQLFRTDKDLYEMIMKFKNMSVGAYGKMVESQWRFINTPHHECGIKSPNWWMEDNIGVWMQVFSMRKKPGVVSITRALELFKMSKKGDEEHPYYVDAENGLMLCL